MKAICIHETGGPEVLRYEEVPTPAPGPGQVQIRQEAIGLNFVDCYYRSGLYPRPLPFIPGNEAAGSVSAVGPGVSEFQVGDAVAYANVMGADAEYAVVEASRVIPRPREIDARTGAAALLQGMTAHYLAHGTYPLKPGDTALVHAAAGGVGRLLVQMAKMRGARVIGTVSTAEKAVRARSAGADEIIRYTEVDFEAEVLRLTGGRGVNVVYDSVGRTTFDKSLNCVGNRGMLVLFGQSSGPIAPLNPARLVKNGVFFARPSLDPYTATRAELLARAGEVLGWVATGQLTLQIADSLPLREAAQAHRLLEGRQASGKILLIP